jgi:translocation and assembly module TamB
VLPQIGPIRDVSVRATFRDRALELHSISGNLGGSTVTLSGQADLRGASWRHGALPPFALSLLGTNVPLSREPGSIIRSDLNLRVAKTNGTPALISGEARLRESFLSSDLTDLVPRQSAAPSARPPYFSVSDPLLADWGLAVSVNGSRFLRVNSTLFRGSVSAYLKLQGTLKEPIALGDLKIDSGYVVFPFGSLEVQQGFVTLNSQDPYRPRLSVSAGSKQFGYDVKMDASGTVDSPVIQFTSTPPLSSEQILLMVSAGQLPQGGVNLTPQQREQTLAMFLGQDVLTELGFAGQGQQRLTIRSGEEISEHGVPSYEVELKLSRRWALVGERDRFDDYNAGLKWQIYSK